MTLEGGAIGEVIDSRAKEFKPGDAVTSNFGWREYFTASPNELHRVSREVCPLSAYLGALGMTGMTAWVGLKLAELKTGDVIFISGAAGAVGSVAGQLAKLRGCRAGCERHCRRTETFWQTKEGSAGDFTFRSRCVGLQRERF
jgi:NADPH-dependent curcumin reductase CurA